MLEEAYRRLPVGIATNFAFSLIVWMVLQSMGGHGQGALIWLGVIAVVDVIDFAGYWMYRVWSRSSQPDLDGSTYVRWYWQYFGQSVLTGLAWGVGSVAVLHPLDRADSMPATFVCMVITGLATSVPAVICPHRSGSWIMMAGMMLPLSAYLIASEIPAYQLIGAAMSGGWVLQCVLSHLMHSSLRAQFRSEEMLRVAVVDAKAARIHAEQAAASKTQFFANMSHELRTPIHAIFGMQHLLEATTLSEKQLGYVRNTRQAGDILLGLVNDVLDLASIEAGKAQITPYPFALHPMLEQLQTVLLAAIGEKPLVLSLVTDPSTPRFLIGDERRITQVLLNLGSNAIKFSSNGQVRVSIDVVSRQHENIAVCFKVSDEGIGIDPQRHASIFDDFVQANATIAQKYGGNGLGLAISKRFVTLMGGDLTLQSSLGIGSTFSFTIALSVVEDDAPELASLRAADVPYMASARLQGMRILVVDDDPLNREVAQSLLQNEGAQAAVAESGKKSIALVLANPSYFDVVLMDLRMPDMDGYETTRQLRTRYSASELPILAVSANAMRDDVDASLNAGMNDHISKPFVIDTLVGGLQRYRRIS